MKICNLISCVEIFLLRKLVSVFLSRLEPFTKLNSRMLQKNGLSMTWTISNGKLTVCRLMGTLIDLWRRRLLWLQNLWKTNNWLHCAILIIAILLSLLSRNFFCKNYRISKGIFWIVLWQKIWLCQKLVGRGANSIRMADFERHAQEKVETWFVTTKWAFFCYSYMCLMNI